MKVVLAFVLAFLALASGFRLAPLSTRVRTFALKSAESEPSSGMKKEMKRDTPPAPAAKPAEPKFEMVPLDKTNIENAAAVTGGIFGFILGGPILAAIFAATTNYLAKKDNDSGEAFRGVGKSVIESYNYLNKLNAKYGITGKIGSSLSSAVSSIDSDSEALETVKTTYQTTTTKLAELNKEYDLVGKGKELVVAAGTLSDSVIDKVVELNQKYDFVEKAKSAASSAATTAAEKAKEATK